MATEFKKNCAKLNKNIDHLKATIDRTLASYCFEKEDEHSFYFFKESIISLLEKWMEKLRNY